jgi:hypothetical protein
MTPDWWTIVGTVIGAISLILAVVQTIRYQVAKRLLRRINEREQLATWALYDLIVQAYDIIGEARTTLRSEPNSPVQAVEKTAQAASLLNAMWLKTVEHAAMLEPEFREPTLQRWVDLGRLDSDWRLARARKLLPRVSDEPLP